MYRSGYSDECCGSELARWRGAVSKAICGKRGQTFLRELATEMDKMPDKKLIAHELIDSAGRCCAIGVICKSRGIDIATIDESEPIEVAKVVGIARALAAEIAFMNDEAGFGFETPRERWLRVRTWVDSQLLKYC